MVHALGFRVSSFGGVQAALKMASLSSCRDLERIKP